MSRKSKNQQSVYNNRQVRQDYLYQKNEPAVSLRVTGAVSTTKKNNYFLNLLMLLFFDCGVFATLRIIKNFTDINFNETFVYIGLAVFSLIIWIISMLPKIKPLYLFLSGTAITTVAFFLFYGKIMAQINIIIGLIIWSPPFINLVDITHIILVCAMFISLIFYMLTFCAGKGWIMVLVSVPFLIMSPIYDIDIELLDLFLLGLFFVGSYTIGNVHNPSKRKKRKVHRLSASERMSAGGSGAAILMALFLVFSILAYTFATPRLDNLYEIPMTVESIVQQTISSVVNVEPDNGNVNKGNNYSFGQKHLEIVTSQQPKDAVYLKNYTGGYYNNGRWNTVNENSFFSNMQDGNYYSMICNNPYYILQFVLEESDVMDINVRSYKSLMTGTCVPVLSQETGSENGYTTYQGYNLSDFLSVLDTVSAGGFDDLLGEYGAYAESTYMYVPEDKIPRIVELCNTSGVRKGNYTAATNFIISTLNEMTTYTTSPGNAPSGVDIAEYFLFDSGKGFCQQYATTAALMYRLLGLPSRYVTGYMVTPSDFHKNSDGTYTAIATDEKAHAWVEVYVDGTGWIPTEVTFSQDEIDQGGSTAVDDNNPTEEPTSEEATTEPTENTTEPSDLTEPTTEPNNTNSSDNNNSMSEMLIQALKIVVTAVITVVVIIAVILFFKWRRKGKLASLRRMKPNILLVKMVDMLHLGGYLKEYKGTESDFPEKLSELVEELSVSDIAYFVNLANKAAFGNKPIEKDEKHTAYNLYVRTAEFVFGKLNFIKKIYFKYFKVYY
ncbi:MAG: transglutaminase-like domain-containing protein [Anaeromassilibacillus sp.]|nr:transglutaminase-like domain-containing protein [Anaeromassilibacillus sp.]MDY3779133.1 transglutaminase-like domain-containing protein [Candidatus Limousia pullorum]